MLEIDLTGRTALVTGATQGIGKSIAELLQKAGANLILTGTKNAEIESLNRENNKPGIQDSRYLQLDLADDVSIQKFLQDLTKYSAIDICVNNAGINIVSDFGGTTEQDFDLINQINLKGPYKLLKAVTPLMVKNNYGRIVNVASIWSVVTRKGRSLYSSSKNGLVGLTKTLAVEMASQNVLVNAVSPGFTLTELTKRTNSVAELKSIASNIPIGRMAAPDEIANLIVYLCSDLNTYITGQNITIDGGYTNL
ncbi:MAG: SDR family oxidoreductase [Candidatus Scalindua sp.]|jgi:3-oxoacyl-[acyl-carrier protein] reductase|nr:SDR family oxidoreductase [Candidatus Scalindua sp.]